MGVFIFNRIFQALNEKGDENHPFLNYKDFPDLVRIRDNYPVILQELRDNNIWMNWGSDAYDPSGNCKFLEGNWTICPIYFNRYSPFIMNFGDRTEEDIRELLELLPARFPKTIELLKPFANLNFASFSRLHPNSSLSTHKHYNPGAWISHIGLIIPPDGCCGLKVADEMFMWNHPGDILVFNDNLEHSAWNHSNEERIVLYLDFQRQDDLGSVQE
jgi:Aspartyl/Asparaginyl beta-hydroxylase